MSEKGPLHARTELVVSLTVTLVVISTIIFGLRLYMRCILLRIAGADDWTMLVAQLMAMCCSIATCIGNSPISKDCHRAGSHGGLTINIGGVSGLGQHMDTLSSEDTKKVFTVSSSLTQQYMTFPYGHRILTVSPVSVRVHHDIHIQSWLKHGQDFLPASVSTHLSQSDIAQHLSLGFDHHTNLDGCSAGATLSYLHSTEDSNTEHGIILSEHNTYLDAHLHRESHHGLYYLRDSHSPGLVSSNSNTPKVYRVRYIRSWLLVRVCPALMTESFSLLAYL